MNTLDLSRDVVKPELYDRINVVIPKGIGVWGYEGMRLARLAADVPEGGVIVEIGSFRGRSAAFMASGLQQSGKKDVKIYCVDIWLEESHMQAADRGLKELGLRGYAELIRGNSLEVAKTWKKPIDLLFIDGAHDYASVKQDFIAWFPHLKKGNVIMFHDYQNHWPGVVRFVEEVTDDGLVERIGKHHFLWTGIKK